MKKYIIIFFLLFSAKCFSQINVVPMPAEVTIGKGNFVLNKQTKIFIAGGNLHKEAAMLNSYLQQKIGYGLQIIKGYENGIMKNEPISNYITLNFDRLDYKLSGAYVLKVNKNNVYIGGDNSEAVFYAIQTLLQLIENNNQTNTKHQTTNSFTIKQLTIKDYPRFPYRGMHLDVARHFFSVDYVKKYIDYLAAYKYNTFHWHLTEDQGWRIEIKKYPNLTKVGSYRDRTLIGRYGSNTYDSIRYGGYYTQSQIKEIVKYAAERYITVIPEIEMPGHSTAALASYPYLGCTKGPYKVMDTWGVLDDVYCAGNDSTFTFLQNVLDEVMQLFPSKYIHIGGDECPKERWKKCVACQKRMKDNNLKDEHALQSYFIQRMEKYLNGKGRSIIGWDEILEGGLAPNATVMSWRGEEGGIEAAKQNHDVIMTPGSHCYLDHSQTKNEDSVTIGSYLPLEKIYNYEPVPAVLNTKQQTHILGAQGNVWTEYMNNTSKLEYMIFPRMIALSEVLWSPKAKRDWKDFERRLPSIFERLDKEKVNYSKAYYDLETKVLPTEDFDGVLFKVQSTNKKYDIKYIPHLFSSLMLPYEKPLLIKEDVKQMTIFLIKDDNRINEISQSFHFNKATGKKITLKNKPNKPYEADGAFTLVNGIQNEKGFARSAEFIAFEGTDLHATIDFGKDVEVSKITLHTLNQTRSWIYLPTEIEVSFIPYIDTTIVTRHPPIESIFKKVDDKKNKQVLQLTVPKTCRYLRVVAKNFGTIPTGQPGEGKQAWLFVDEIEVE
jgi:hexosaminidase